MSETPKDLDGLREMLMREIAGKCFNDEAARHAVRSILAALADAGLVIVQAKLAKPYILLGDEACHELRGPIADVYATLIAASPFAAQKDNSHE